MFNARCWTVALVTTLFASSPARGQTVEPGRNPSSRPAAAPAWLPGVSIGVGRASVGMQPPESPFRTFVSSVRVELLRHLSIEGEWSAPAKVTESHATSNTQHELRMTAVNILGTARTERISASGGIGIGSFDRSRADTQTRTGCTGPWVSDCETGNSESSRSWSGNAFLLVGGLDVNVLPRLDLFMSGRLGGSQSLEEYALLLGVRTTVIPDRMRRGLPAARVDPTDTLSARRGEEVWITHADGTEDHGTLVSSSGGSVTVRGRSRTVTVPLASLRAVETPDSILSGMLWGAGAGFAPGLFIAGNGRAITSTVLIGAGIGAVLDALTPHRRIRYAAAPATDVRLVPAAGAGVASLGLRVAWP